MPPDATWAIPAANAESKVSDVATKRLTKASLKQPSLASIGIV